MAASIQIDALPTASPADHVADSEAGHRALSPTSNRENPNLTKYPPTDDYPRQRTASSGRTPLSTILPGQKPSHESNKSIQVRTNGGKPMRADASSKSALYGLESGNQSLKKSDSYDDIPENMYRPEKGEYEGWIHREKLAKIENEELQAAGINLAKARTRSRDALGDRLNKDGAADNSRNVSRANLVDDKRQKISSPVNEEDERSNWDLRTPEEIAAEQAAGQFFVSPVLRRSGSKIPVMTSSPTPIPAQRYERDTPMPRKRTMSGSLAPDDSLYISKSRGGGADNENASSGSQGGSPTKMRSKSVTGSRPGTSSGLKSAPGVRKASAPVKTTASASSSSNARPSTRGNDSERPRTATNRPEGDPPWLATMYKPDPLLPPDQQIIPTHARRQQQEQWAANGEIPTTYDRDFNPLAIHDSNHTIPPATAADQPVPKSMIENQRMDDNAWPLKPLPFPPESPSPNKPIANGGLTGGYSTMPKLAEQPIGLAASPVIGSPSSDRESRGFPPNGQGKASSINRTFSPSNATAVQAHRMPQISEKDNEKLEKKGCCCIVM